ncbi:hypothetical protein HOK00_01160 [bacterium]|jgi:hypothetical protein|nr:hypothetical protein [bacterium]
MKENLIDSKIDLSNGLELVNVLRSKKITNEEFLLLVNNIEIVENNIEFLYKIKEKDNKEYASLNETIANLLSLSVNNLIVIHLSFFNQLNKRTRKALKEEILVKLNSPELLSYYLYDHIHIFGLIEDVNIYGYLNKLKTQGRFKNEITFEKPEIFNPNILYFNFVKMVEAKKNSFEIKLRYLKERIYSSSSMSFKKSNDKIIKESIDWAGIKLDRSLYSYMGHVFLATFESKDNKINIESNKSNIEEKLFFLEEIISKVNFKITSADKFLFSISYLLKNIKFFQYSKYPNILKAICLISFKNYEKLKMRKEFGSKLKGNLDIYKEIPITDKNFIKHFIDFLKKEESDMSEQVRTLYILNELNPRRFRKNIKEVFDIGLLSYLSTCEKKYFSQVYTDYFKSLLLSNRNVLIVILEYLIDEKDSAKIYNFLNVKSKDISENKIKSKKIVTYIRENKEDLLEKNIDIQIYLYLFSIKEIKEEELLKKLIYFINYDKSRLSIDFFIIYKLVEGLKGKESFLEEVNINFKFEYFLEKKNKIRLLELIKNNFLYLFSQRNILEILFNSEEDFVRKILSEIPKKEEGLEKIKFIFDKAQMFLIEVPEDMLNDFYYLKVESLESYI